MSEIEDDSIDEMVTDPPYGLEFMGKDWDKALPDIKIWQECLRVLKPGAFAFVMCIPRSDLQSKMVGLLEKAGFVTSFSPIYWTYASGFPKSMNMGTAIDKRLGVESEEVEYEHPQRQNRTESYNIGFDVPSRRVIPKTRKIATSKEAKELDGAYTMNLKPAIEVILVAMKPLNEKTYVDQALKNKKGVVWLDDCRIPTKEVSERVFKDHHDKSSAYGGSQKDGWGTDDRESRPDWEMSPEGRFPANLLVSDDALNTDEGSVSRYYDLDAWFQVRVLDNLHKLPEGIQKTFPFLVVAKPSPNEKNAGLKEPFDKERHIKEQLKKLKPNSPIFEFRPTLLTNPENWATPIQETPYGGANRSGTQSNNHPTCKPIKLMSYLITLGSRPGDTILDPFLGSGTTAIASVLTDRKCIGIELDNNYFEIAMRRLQHHTTIKKKENLKTKYQDSI